MIWDRASCESGTYDGARGGGRVSVGVSVRSSLMEGGRGGGTADGGNGREDERCVLDVNGLYNGWRGSGWRDVGGNVVRGEGKRVRTSGRM